MNVNEEYRTAGGLVVRREVRTVDPVASVEALIDRLDAHRGVLLSSSYEFPGRYTRWDLGFADPMLALTTSGRHLEVVAMNQRGRMLLHAVRAAVDECDAVASTSTRADGDGFDVTVAEPTRRFDEEERSRQPSVFSVVRTLVELFRSPEDAHLGLYGAFGYDLAFQFEPVRLRLERPADQRDVVLYLPDELLVVDHQRELAKLRSYDFVVDGRSTEGIARTGAGLPYRPSPLTEPSCDHEPGEYAVMVEAAKEAFRRGDLFEVVPGQCFTEPCASPPSALFRRLRTRNPAPYGFLINLGAEEYLVGASPEMYVRVEDDRVETCPISGTIARGTDPISDAAQILALLNSDKDASELTMCTDVDRNDKSRVCEPGSVRVIGRRQIEMYSRLIHTVDHVEGRLRPEFDALDAFLTHTWAVTVTGAPKAWAMQWIEDHERSARAWYGGAVGRLTFDGNMNTGLTLRTIRVKDGAAQVRVGATLLFDSDPDAEEQETHLKASAFLDAIREPVRPAAALSGVGGAAQPGAGRRLLLVDHQDSFVHTLANYFRSTGAEVVTLRTGFDPAEWDRVRPDLVVLSPGPGRPEDFGLDVTISEALRRDLPVFGVCLGLQGLVEHFGGRLGVLDVPMHGKTSSVKVVGGQLFDGLPERFLAGRYHSLFALPGELPDCLEVTAESEDGVIMAVEHRSLPVAAVQFHPESIMTLGEDAGMRLIRNVVGQLSAPVPEQPGGNP